MNQLGRLPHFIEMESAIFVKPKACMELGRLEISYKVLPGAAEMLNTIGADTLSLIGTTQRYMRILNLEAYDQFNCQKHDDDRLVVDLAVTASHLQNQKDKINEELAKKKKI
jgi:hypothetical protein